MLSIAHLFAVFVYFNVALAGFDHSILWKTAVANACMALLVPSKLWNRLMASFHRRPMASHVAVSTLVFLSVGLVHQVVFPITAHIVGTTGL
ncbi:hypothetical protein HFO56_01860 [Rhizobium laguerreae]|uniref:hypothetical protein n=1 Tax=Rhizobium laguerreae TaxID=1076926 RepID=UPI001C91D096|nr:hypothetical protein [Rhizobium laguerreae]MBY3151152.1 hypothetical protein [Rhizobium laguerreae]